MPSGDFNNLRTSITGRAISRRRLLAAVPALGLIAAGFAACGDDDDDDRGNASTSGSNGATPDAPASAGAESAYPVTIEHEFGSTTIESAPKRIVAAGFNEVDFLLAFGVVPVGVRDFIGQYQEDRRPWAVDLIGDAELVVVGGQEIDFEQVAALDPDLIMAVYAFLDEGAYEKLSGIAPTVAGPAGGATWKEQTRITGRALGQEARAEDLIREIDEHFERAKNENPGFNGKSLAIVWGVGNVGEGYYLLPETDLRAQFFYNLGFVPPEQTGRLSVEQASALDQDVIVVFGWTPEQLAGDPLFQGLPAVQAGRVIYYSWDSDFAGALGFSSPLSIPYAIDLVVPELAAAVKRG